MKARTYILICNNLWLRRAAVAAQRRGHRLIVETGGEHVAKHRMISRGYENMILSALGDLPSDIMLTPVNRERT